MKEELLPNFFMSERLTLLYQYQHPGSSVSYLYFFFKSLFLVQTDTREVGRAL